MYDPEAFRTNLLDALEKSGLTAAELCRKANLNSSAFQDVVNGKSISPKLSTVFAFSEALEKDPGEMIGLKPHTGINSDLAKYLAQFDELTQLRILQALVALPLLGKKAP